jgi:hypothetical protein
MKHTAIYIDEDPHSLDGFAVYFEDDNGRSMLARCATRKEAVARAKYFNNEIRSGRLLTEDPSVWCMYDHDHTKGNCEFHN